MATYEQGALYINQLDPTIPLNNDKVYYGIWNLRTIKTVLVNQFPNFSTEAIKYTIAEFNNLSINLQGVDTGISEWRLKVLPPNYPIPVNGVKTLRHNIDGVVKPSEPLSPLGEMIWSALTEAQMDILYGTSPKIYVRADGRLISGSRYALITGLQNVIDARDRYVANTADFGNFGTLVSAELNTSTIKSSSIGKLNIDSFNNSVSFDEYDGVPGHSHSYYLISNSGAIRCVAGNGANLEFPADSGTQATTGTGDHRHFWYDMSFKNQNNWTDDTSTQPKHINLNAFVRIN